MWHHSNFHTEWEAHPGKNVFGGQRQQAGEGQRGAEGRCRAASCLLHSLKLITDPHQLPQAELEETLVLLMLREREVTKVGPSVWNVNVRRYLRIYSTQVSCPCASMQRDMLMDKMKCSHLESHSMIEVSVLLGLSHSKYKYGLSLGNRAREQFRENHMFFLCHFLAVTLQ